MLILIFVLWAITALTFPIGKIALRMASSPLQLLGLRMTVAGILLLAWSGYKNMRSQQSVRFRCPSKFEFFLLLQVTLFHVYLAFVPEFWALQFVDSIKANLLFSLSPFASAVLSALLLNKTLSKKKLLGLTFGGFGMLCIIMTQNVGEVVFGAWYRLSLPEAVLLLGVLSSCYAWFVIRRLLHAGYQLQTINGIAFFGGGLLCWLQYFYLSGSRATLLPTTGTPLFLLLIGLLIFGSNIISYNLYGLLLKRHSNTFVSLTGFLCPVFGMVYSRLFARYFPQYFASELISPWYLGGLSTIVIGLIIFYGQEALEENVGFFN